MPHAPPEMLLPTTLASLLARPGPKMTMPRITGTAYIVGEDLGPGRIEHTVPTKVLSVMSYGESCAVNSQRLVGIVRDSGIDAIPPDRGVFSVDCF